MPEDATPAPEAQPPESDAVQVPAELVIEAKATETPAITETPSQPKSPSSVTSGPSQTQETLDKLLQQAQVFWKKAQPVLQEKSIQALLVANRFTNHFLDNLWPKLSQQAIALSQQAIAAIPADTKAKVEAQKAKVQPTLDKLQPVWEKGVVPFWQNTVVPTWMKGIAFLKQKLPDSLKELTERFLTVAVLTVLVLVYWFFSSLTAPKPIATQSPTVPKPIPSPIAQRPVTVPSPKVAPTIAPAPRPVVTASSPKPNVAVSPSPKPSPVAAPSVAPQSVTSPAIDLAAIQDQLTRAIPDADETLITSVQSLEDRLRVTLGDGWNSLSPDNQRQAAQTLWQRSQKLNYNKFELRDPAGQLVARSPVVGSNVILFNRPSA